MDYRRNKCEYAELERIMQSSACQTSSSTTALPFKLNFSFPSPAPKAVPSSLCSPPETSTNAHTSLHDSYPHDQNKLLVGTMPFHERHVFLCFKTPQCWPSSMESFDWGSLPNLLRKRIRDQARSMGREVCFTVCEGHDNGPASYNGDILIFPDMLLYRAMTRFDVDCFVEEALVKEQPRALEPQPVEGCHVFVCCHSNRATSCGSIGPLVVEQFEKQIAERGLSGQVFVRRCSHLGPDCCGSVAIFRPHQTCCSACGGTSFSPSFVSNGQVPAVASDWYGHVMPKDVVDIVERHILQGGIVERLWRGRGGVRVEGQQELQSERLKGKGTEVVGMCCCRGEQAEGNSKPEEKRGRQERVGEDRGETEKICSLSEADCLLKKFEGNEMESHSIMDDVGDFIQGRKANHVATGVRNTPIISLHFLRNSLDSLLKAFEKDEIYTAALLGASVATIAVAAILLRQRKQS